MAEVEAGQKKHRRKSSGRDAAQRGKKFSNPNVEDMLVEGEHVVDEAFVHNGIYWKSIAVLIISILIAIFVVIELGMLLAFVALLMFTYETFRKEVLMLVLTNRRIFVRYGVLQVDVVDIRFSKIESIELERMLPGYLMGYANLIVMGTGQRYIVIPYVGNAAEIRRAYNRMTLADGDEIGT